MPLSSVYNYVKQTLHIFHTHCLCVFVHECMDVSVMQCFLWCSAGGQGDNV